MKVSTDFSDGCFSMKPAEPRQDWQSDQHWSEYELGLVEISEAEWAEYVLYLDAARKWNNRIGDLDNLAWEQRKVDQAPLTTADLRVYN